jgi:hypothetical protein
VTELVVGIVALVAAAFAGGYFLLGSPSHRTMSPETVRTTDDATTPPKRDRVRRVVLGFAGLLAASPIGVAPIALDGIGVLLVVGVQVLGLVALTRAFRSHSAATLVSSVLAYFWLVAWLMTRDFHGRMIASSILLEQTLVLTVYGALGFRRPGRLRWKIAAVATPGVWVLLYLIVIVWELATGR